MAGVPAPRRAPAPSRATESDRPRLRVVGPPRRRWSGWSVRATVAVAVALVLGSLLFVAGAQAYLTQQSVRLGQVQAQLASQSGEHRNLEWRVAQLSNPAHVVRAAQGQGLTVPSQITDLPPVTVPPVVATHPASHSSAAGRAGRARAAGVGSR